MIVENNNCNIDQYDQAALDEANDSGSLSDDQPCTMKFQSTPNVMIYLGNNDNYKQFKDLIKLVFDLGIGVKIGVKLNSKKYIFVNKYCEPYIYGINKIADKYFNRQEFTDNPRTTYIDGEVYVNVLKKVIIKFATHTFLAKEIDVDSQSSELEYERDKIEIQAKLLRELSKYPCITNEDFVRIIGRELVKPSDHLKQVLGEQRLASIIQLAKRG